MVVVKTAKSGGSLDVIGAADEINGLNQGHLLEVGRRKLHGKFFRNLSS